MEGYYTKLIYLIIFLIIFYLFDLLLNIFLNSLLKIVNDFNFFRFNMNNMFISVFFDFLTSLLVIIFLDSLSKTINLTIDIKIFIAFIHTFLIILIQNLQTEKKEQDDKEKITNLPESIKYEIKYYLQKENMINCIDLIKEKYPHIPKAIIIKSVREINNESK